MPMTQATHDNQIAAAKLFFVDQRFENQQVDRRGVLQEDRVGGGSLFRGQHEEQKQGGIKH